MWIGFPDQDQFDVFLQKEWVKRFPPLIVGSLDKTRWATTKDSEWCGEYVENGE